MFGHALVLPESPVIMSKMRLSPGIFKIVPNIGTLLKKLIATGRNPLKILINLNIDTESMKMQKNKN